MKYMVRNIDRPNNTPFYSIHSNLDSFILYNEDEISQQENENEIGLIPSKQSKQSPKEESNSPDLGILEQKNDNEHEIESLWEMSFDGSCRKNSFGAGVWIHNTNQ